MNWTGCGSSPAERWREDALRPTADERLRLRLAAMAGHMMKDLPAARRGALIDALADGRPHAREDLIQRLMVELGENCWGLRPHEALLRDIAALRRGGVRMAYSRRPGLEGYYLEYPPLGDGSQPVHREPADDDWIAGIRAMSPVQKVETAFAAAEFALRQKRALIRHDRPELPDDEVDLRARRLVFDTR